MIEQLRATRPHRGGAASGTSRRRRSSIGQRRSGGGGAGRGGGAALCRGVQRGRVAAASASESDGRLERLREQLGNVGSEITRLAEVQALISAARATAAPAPAPRSSSPRRRRRPEIDRASPPPPPTSRGRRARGPPAIRSRASPIRPQRPWTSWPSSSRWPTRSHPGSQPPDQQSGAASGSHYYAARARWTPSARHLSGGAEERRAGRRQDAQVRRVRDAESADGVVLRALRGGAGGDLSRCAVRK